MEYEHISRFEPLEARILDPDPVPHQGENSYPDPHQGEKSDPDTHPHQGDKSNPDPHQSDADPQHRLYPYTR
jgi:hypothetical protein